MMKMDIHMLEKQLAMTARRFVSSEEADYFASLYMETHLKKSPRMNPLAEAVADLTVWDRQTGNEVTLLVDKGAVTVMDFNGLAPSLKIKKIHDTLADRAGQFGLAAAGFRNSSGVITLNMWADGLARRDLIGIAMFNGGTGCAVPFGGTRGVLGTNPLAYAIPTAADPMVLDMATTEIPFFEIKNAKEKGAPLRRHVAVDSHGRPTTAAEEALSENGVANLLPIGGGFKGFGITLLIEVLTGALVQSLLSTDQTPGWHPHEYGCLVLALDIAGFTDRDVFKHAVSDMSRNLRNETPADGVDRVVIPGDRGHEKLKMARKVGRIEIEKTMIDALNRLNPQASEPSGSHLPDNLLDV
jgi:LDH2 family malate/lactate/ureidoglycolate dehydrogenase